MSNAFDALPGAVEKTPGGLESFSPGNGRLF